MKNIGFALALFVLLAHGIEGRLFKKKKHNKKSNKQLRSIIAESKKTGLFLASFIGDKYLQVSNNHKLVGTENLNNANLFNIKLKFKRGGKKMDSVQLRPWILGRAHVITYNALGEDINIELPLDTTQGSKSDATEFIEVIARNAEHPVYIVKSKYRNRCITLEPVTNEYYLKACSRGGDDLQTFRFLTYDEAKKLQARKRNSAEFDIRNFLLNTRVGAGGMIIGDKNGVLFEDK